MLNPVVDLHCDLLSYLAADPKRTPDDLESKTSYPQLSSGGVVLQTLALFCKLQKGSATQGEKQVLAFQNLLTHHTKHFTKEKRKDKQIQVIAAIENGSIFAEEDEPLTKSLERLSLFEKVLGKILYISLTWNEENRFGGGNETTVGLKPDGEVLLEFLDKKQIAIDLSHTSDPLAEGILSFIDRKKLEIPVLASHSNFRAICNRQRNLPDAIAKEIIARKGVIGMNFFAPFVHPKDPYGLIKHIEYGLKLGGENALALGADFFVPEDFSYILNKYGDIPPFFPQYADSSCYQQFLTDLQERLKISYAVLEKIASTNALRFIGQ